MSVPLYAYRNKEKIQIGTADVNADTGEVKCTIEDAQMMADLSISVQSHSIGWVRHEFGEKDFRGGVRLNDLLREGQRLTRADIVFKYPVPIIEEGPND